MPLLRYFVFVGGALLALIFAADAFVPTVPLPSDLTSASDLPTVRIQSTRKLPERVVIDTNVALPAPTKVATVDVATPTPVAAATPAPEFTAKARVREAFAQFVPESTGPKAADSRAPQKRRIAKAHPPASRPLMLVAQQPHFGFPTTW
jgi:hypothetical protein